MLGPPYLGKLPYIGPKDLPRTPKHLLHSAMVPHVDYHKLGSEQKGHRGYLGRCKVSVEVSKPQGPPRDHVLECLGGPPERWKLPLAGIVIFWASQVLGDYTGRSTRDRNCDNMLGMCSSSSYLTLSKQGAATGH